MYGKKKLRSATDQLRPPGSAVPIGSYTTTRDTITAQFNRQAEPAFLWFPVHSEGRQTCISVKLERIAVTYKYQAIMAESGHGKGRRRSPALRHPPARHRLGFSSRAVNADTRGGDMEPSDISGDGFSAWARLCQSTGQISSDLMVLKNVLTAAVSQQCSRPPIGIRAWRFRGKAWRSTGNPPVLQRPST
ncbi:hypothetical protein ACEWPM_012515 [Roseovarius sp. S4756]|uniref:hypothetical protein n=1 Tax=Roseovarius maritimus TaxID=3342637 RepID=UPI00372708F3